MEATFLAPSGAFIVDNILFPNADPTFTYYGVLFTTGAGNEWNLWGQGISPNNSSLWKWDANADPAQYTVTQNDGTMTLTAVGAIPEPETYPMLLAGLGLLGFAARRRKMTACTGQFRE